MIRPRIPCPTCEGGGQIALPDPLWRTLVRVASLGEATAREIHRLLGNNRIGVTAIHNRLEELRRLGLVERDGRGRAWIYRLAQGV